MKPILCSQTVPLAVGLTVETAMAIPPVPAETPTRAVILTPEDRIPATVGIGS